MTTYSPTVFPSFQTSDAEAMIGLLDSLGLAQRALVRDDNDPIGAQLAEELETRVVALVGERK